MSGHIVQLGKYHLLCSHTELPDMISFPHQRWLEFRGTVTLSNTMMPTEAGKTAVSIGTGFYKGRGAVGINVTHALPGYAQNRSHVSAGLSVAGNGNNLFRASAGFQF